jgi:hypothetical protein
MPSEPKLGCFGSAANVALPLTNFERNSAGDLVFVVITCHDGGWHWFAVADHPVEQIRWREYAAWFLNTLWGIGHNGLQQDVEGNMLVCFVGSKLYMQNSVTTTCAARNKGQVLLMIGTVQVPMLWDCMKRRALVLQYRIHTFFIVRILGLSVD